jgi:hypothetical protein
MHPRLWPGPQYRPFDFLPASSWKIAATTISRRRKMIVMSVKRRTGGG